VSELSRRRFLSALAGAGVLSLGFEYGCAGDGTQTRVRHAESTGDLIPNMYITVKRDGRVGVEVDNCDFGQGVTSMFSTLVAEELDVELAAVDCHFPDSFPAYRTTANMQITGGSASTREKYLPVRTAAAAAKGMLVAAAAAEWRVSPAECTTARGFVSHAGSGRTVGYGALTVAAARQPVPASPRLKAKSAFTLIGKPARRVDARAKVDGSARFGIDTVVPGMARAYILHGPVYGANATEVRAGAARGKPGIVDVFAFPGGVAIVAEKYWQARAAAKDVEVRWDQGDVAGLDTEQMRRAVHAYADDGDAVRDDGNAARAIARAPSKVSATYEAPFLAHAPMEPQNCIVHVRKDIVEVWAPCQSPSIVQALIAEALGVHDRDVLVHTTLIGGAFGRRIVADFAVQAAHISRRIGRPVQVIWSRESDMTQGFYRPQLAARMSGGVTADGHVSAISAQVLGQFISLDFLPSLGAALAGVPNAVRGTVIDALKGVFASGAVPDLFATEGISDTPYLVPNLRVAMTPVNTRLPVASWRSVGHSFTGFALEGFLDELAHAAHVDPLELRRRILPEASRARRVLDTVAAMAGWSTPPRPGIGRGLARHQSFESEVAQIAEVEMVNGRIKVRRVFAAVDCGTVVNPDIVRAQVEGAIIFGLSAALDQQITLENGVVQQTNFDGFPLLRMHECPEIVVKLLDSDEKPTGIGEPGLPPVAPAVANAIFALTGVRLRRMPLQRAWDEAHAGGAAKS
jgi:CO/xanthine dehydrogenase Mo-binding subunit